MAVKGIAVHKGAFRDLGAAHTGEVEGIITLDDSPQTLKGSHFVLKDSLHNKRLRILLFIESLDSETLLIKEPSSAGLGGLGVSFTGTYRREKNPSAPSAHQK